MADLADLFRESKGGPITWEGHTVHGIFRSAGQRKPVVVAVHVEHAAPWPRQAVRLQVEGGKFILDSDRATKLILWADRFPDGTAAFEARPTRGKELTIFASNAWESAQGGTDYWLRNAGMLVERLTPRSVRLRCSTGLGDPVFTALVVRLELVEPPDAEL